VNGGEVTSEPDPDVVAWKARLRELRATIATRLSTLTVEDAWEEWQEKYNPLPADVVTAAKGLIDKRLAEMKAEAAKYEEAKGA
jgi:hypothetical protein